MGEQYHETFLIPLLSACKQGRHRTAAFLCHVIFFAYEVVNMAYETKVLLIALARFAIMTNSKAMYEIIAEMANAEGVVLKPYDEALAKPEE